MVGGKELAKGHGEPPTWSRDQNKVSQTPFFGRRMHYYNLEGRDGPLIVPGAPKCFLLFFQFF